MPNEQSTDRQQQQALREAARRDFQTRVRQLVMHSRSLRTRLAQSLEQTEQLQQQIVQLQAENEQLRRRYDNLKLAKMIEIGDDDMKNARQRLARLIREVDKCIALLNV